MPFRYLRSPLSWPGLTPGSRIPVPQTPGPSVQGAFKNLLITNTTSGTAASHVIVTADQLLLWNAAGLSVNLQSISLDINANAGGLNGLDTGSFAASTWYYVWVIFNPTTGATAGLLSASATAPTLPSGFTYRARFGAIRTSAGTAFLNMMQKGRRAQYLVGTFGGNALAALPNIANGTAGTFSTTAPTYASVSVANFVPTTAAEITVVVTNKYNNLGISSVQLAPNSSYAGSASVNPPPWQLINTLNDTSVAISMVLESTNISWTSSATGGGIFAMGWVDNL